MNSPFSTAPATATGSAITNFNVLLSGVQLYSQNYNFPGTTKIKLNQWWKYVGDVIWFIVSKWDFENGYRFITADLSRKPSEAVDNIAKSIQVIGTNSSSLPIDIFWFVFYERQIEIDIQTGSLIA